MTVGLCGEDVTVGQQHEILLGKYDALIAAAGLRARPQIHCMPVYAAARPSDAGSAHTLSRLQHSLGRILSGKHRVVHSIVSSHRTCQQTADQEHQFPIIQPLFLLLSPFSPPRWHPPPGVSFSDVGDCPYRPRFPIAHPHAARPQPIADFQCRHLKNSRPKAKRARY